MIVRTIRKELAGVEDLLLGNGTVQQDRSNGPVTISKIDIPAIVDTVEDLVNIDSAKYRVAIVLSSGLYKYNGLSWEVIGGS